MGPIGVALGLSVLNTLLILENLLSSHSVEGLLPVLVHMDGELVHKVFWLNVTAVLIQYMGILLIHVRELLLMVTTVFVIPVS